MGGFLLRKTGAALVVLMLASVLVFAGVRAIPGDPATALGAENRDPAVISAVRGVGSALVGGEVDADTWHVHQDGAIVKRYIAYGHSVNGETRRYVERSHTYSTQTGKNIQVDHL